MIGLFCILISNYATDQSQTITNEKKWLQRLASGNWIGCRHYLTNCLYHSESWGPELRSLSFPFNNMLPRYQTHLQFFSPMKAQHLILIFSATLQPPNLWVYCIYVSVSKQQRFWHISFNIATWKSDFHTFFAQLKNCSVHKVFHQIWFTGRRSTLK